MATSSSKINKSIREITTAQSVIGGLSADILDDVHEDIELRDRVVSQLRHSRIPMFQKLQIEVQNTEVRVTGVVETMFDKQLLARSLKQISGVKVGRLDSVTGGDNLTNHHINAGGWVRPASDILLSGSSKDGTLIPATTQAGTFLNRTNGYDHATETYSGTGFPAPYGTEGSSQPYSFHTGGVNALFGDGRVKLINEETPIGIVAALVTRNGGQNEAKTPEGSY